MMTWMTIAIDPLRPRTHRHGRGNVPKALLRLTALVLLFPIACGNDAPAPSPRALPSPTSKAIEGGPNCRLPRRRPTPRWVPEGLPLPPGTYFYKQLSPKRGLHRGLFVLRVDATGFRAFIDRRWRRAGITTLRPDEEPGEVEDIFRTADATGVFKANDVICDPPYTRLLLIYGA